MRVITASVLVLFFTCISCKNKSLPEKEYFWAKNSSPQIVGNKVSDELLSRKDFMMYETDQVKAVHYAEACAGFGAARLAGLLNDTLRLGKIAERY